MIVVTVLLSIFNQMEFHLVEKMRKENYHHDHIQFNLKENGNVFFFQSRNCALKLRGVVRRSDPLLLTAETKNSVREADLSLHNVGLFKGPSYTP